VNESPDEENPELEENDRPAIIGIGVYLLTYLIWFLCLSNGILFPNRFGAFGGMGIDWFGIKIPLIALCLLIFPQSFKLYKLSIYGDLFCLLTIIASFLFAWWLLFQAWASC